MGRSSVSAYQLESCGRPDAWLFARVSNFIRRPGRHEVNIALRALLFVVAFTIVSPKIASAQIVALGSSTVHGAVQEAEMWPEVLEGLLHAKGSQVHVTNAGVWGETTPATLARVPSAVPAGTKIVILAVNGYNDARRLPEG